MGLISGSLKKILRDVRTGFYTIIVLSLLDKYGPSYGYKIQFLIKQLSNNILNPSESTVYETLKNLEKRRLVKSYWAESELGPPRKYYEITEEGKKVLEILKNEVRKIIAVLDKINEMR